MLWQAVSPPEDSKVQELVAQLNVPEALAVLLVQRGITSYAAAKEYFRPQWEQLHDPYLMEDMPQAVERIARAIAASDPVMVFGDYDVDGTTAVTLVSAYLQTHLEVVLPYIPDRYKEGYGISKAGIDEAKAHGIQLIIALDCGIKAHEQVAYAKELGIDLSFATTTYPTAPFLKQ